MTTFAKAPQISKDKTRAVKVQPNLFLRPDAAQAWERAEAAFGKQVLAAGGGHRNPDCGARTCKICQTCIFTARYVKGDHHGQAGYTNDVRTWNGVKYTRLLGQAAAAVPYTSNHGSGVAVDVQSRRYDGQSRNGNVVFTGWGDEDMKKWEGIALNHGWSNAEGKSVQEFWHKTYYPELDKHKGVAAQWDAAFDAVDKLAQTQAANLPATIDLRNAHSKAVTAPVDAIKTMQRPLGVTMDGVAGAKTKAALGQYQSVKGLPVDYVCGPATWRKILGSN